MQNSDIRTAPGTPNGSTPGLHAADTADLRRDIEQLKSSVSTLTKHLQADGKAKASEIRGAVNEGISSLLDQSDEKLRVVESKVRENPRGAVVAAFCAGLVANLLLRRR